MKGGRADRAFLGGAILAVSSVVFLFAQGQASNWTAPAEGGLPSNLAGGFGVALVAVLWAYKGWEAVSFSAGEIANPQRNLPLGLFAGTLIVIVLYVAANVAYLKQMLSRKDAPHAAAAARSAPVVARTD